MNLLHNFRTPFLKKTSGSLLLISFKTSYYPSCKYLQACVSILTKIWKFLLLKFKGKYKNIILSSYYRPRNGDSKNLSPFLQKKNIEKSVSEKKISYISIHLRGLEMNCLKYYENDEIKYFYDVIFEKGVISILNRPK